MDASTPLIQCYPYDVLRSIFQEIDQAKDYTTSTMALATALSSVCRNWRDVALRCPFLWRYITFRMHKLEAVSDMSREIASRTFMVPVEILVDYTGAYNPTGIPPRGALNHCLLHGFPVLHTLGFKFDTSIDKGCVEKHYNSRHDGAFNLTDILNDVHHLPINPIEELTIRHNKTDSKSSLALSFTGVDELVSKLTPSRSLYLSMPRLTLPNVPQSWSPLQDLSVRSQPLEPNILLAVPNLVNLLLGHLTFYLGFSPHPIILLPKLRVLNLDWCPRYRYIPRIQCPNLQELTITSLYPGSWKLFSLSSELAHLTTLTLNLDVDAFGDIALVLPQIKVLSATVFNFRYEILELLSNWRPWGFKEPPFPCLQDLSFDVWQIAGEEGELSLDTFDDFVRNRLLPSGHPERGTHAANLPIPRFNVSGDIEAIGEWLNSTYAGSFKKTEDADHRIVTMKWPRGP